MRRCAGGVLFRNGQVLLGLRSAGLAFYPAKWDMFGGHCEPGESVEQTLVREFEEELGVTPREWRKLGVYPDPDPARHGPAEYHVFAIHEWRGDLRNASDENERIAWFDLADLPALDLAAAEYIQIFGALAQP